MFTRVRYEKSRVCHVLKDSTSYALCGEGGYYKKKIDALDAPFCKRCEQVAKKSRDELNDILGRKAEEDRDYEVIVQNALLEFDMLDSIVGEYVLNAVVQAKKR